MLRSIIGWPLMAILVVLLLRFVPADHNDPLVSNIVSLLGILLLALPAIRVNEEGRLIEGVRELQSGINSATTALEAQPALDDEQREELRKDQKQRAARLESILEQLTAGRGAWTPWVHRTLYTGYVLVLSVAVVRVIP